MNNERLKNIDIFYVAMFLPAHSIIVFYSVGFVYSFGDSSSDYVILPLSPFFSHCHLPRHQPRSSGGLHGLSFHVFLVQRHVREKGRRAFDIMATFFFTLAALAWRDYALDHCNALLNDIQRSHLQYTVYVLIPSINIT